VKRAALALGLPVAQPEELRSAGGRSALLAWHPDVLAVVAYGLILPQAALDVPRLGCLNIHASLLPRWRGAAPIQRAILSGDSETGVSIMRMEAGLDTGPVYLERRVAIGRECTSAALHDELARLGSAALLEALEGISAGTLLPQPQPTEGVTYATKIDKAEARIDWTQPAAFIDRQIRAFVPWPVADTLYGGEQLRIHRAAPTADAGPGDAPGDAAFDPALGLRVRCGAGSIRVLELQRSGRRKVDAADFGRALGGAVVRFGG
jgi:methionyl-tRNA formyltransferase